MQRYLAQLLADIVQATANVSLSYADKQLDLQDWLSPEEEEATAPIRPLEEWTGIYKEQLPPPAMLSGEQIHQLLEALKKMLNAYRWTFVLQTEVPEHIQYAALRDNFNQEAKVKQWHMGFFELCRPGTAHKTCALGDYCQCAFFRELFAGMVDEDLSPEEERRRMLAIEIRHLKRKYDDDWMKYYPYHLDPAYDDEEDNPSNYGGDDFWNDEDADDDK
jgi:hypothetical protein